MCDVPSEIRYQVCVFISTKLLIMLIPGKKDHLTQLLEYIGKSCMIIPTLPDLLWYLACRELAR